MLYLFLIITITILLILLFSISQVKSIIISLYFGKNDYRILSWKQFYLHLSIIISYPAFCVYYLFHLPIINKREVNIFFQGKHFEYALKEKYSVFCEHYSIFFLLLLLTIIITLLLLYFLLLTSMLYS